MDSLDAWRALIKALQQYNELYFFLKTNRRRPAYVFDKLRVLSDRIRTSLASQTIREILDPLLRDGNTFLQALSATNQIGTIRRSARLENEILRECGFSRSEAKNKLLRLLHAPFDAQLRAPTSCNELVELFSVAHDQAVAAAAEIAASVSRDKLRQPRPFTFDAYRMRVFGICAFIANLISRQTYLDSYCVGSLAVSIG